MWICRSEPETVKPYITHSSEEKKSNHFCVKNAPVLHWHDGPWSMHPKAFLSAFYTGQKSSFPIKLFKK